jgi:hypothetical protein
MKLKISVILMAIILFLSFTVLSVAEEINTVSWITEKEAALPAMKPSGAGMKDLPESGTELFQVKKQSMAGPIIIVEKPDPDQLYDDLIDILISFDKNPIGEPVNMESLRVIYLKMFGIDITDRILPYVKETHIDANGIKFPEGEHEFEIRIKDNEQMESSEIIKIKVN